MSSLNEPSARGFLASMAAQEAPKTQHHPQNTQPDPRTTTPPLPPTNLQTNTDTPQPNTIASNAHKVHTRPNILQINHKPTRGAVAGWELAHRRAVGSSFNELLSDAAARGAAQRYYCLGIESLVGSAPPPPTRAALVASASAAAATTLSQRLLLTFFDTTARSFVGSTFETAEAIVDVPSDPSDASAYATITHDVDLYFHSRLTDARVLLVVESSYTLRDARNHKILSEASSGWASIEPFGGATLATAADQCSAPLMRGSPLALAAMKRADASARAEVLKPSSATLRYNLRSHPKLAAAAHLLRDTAIYSEADHVAGLLPYTSLRGAKHHTGGAHIAASLDEPRLATPFALSASALLVELPEKLAAAAAAAAAAADSTAATAAAATLRWRALVGAHTGEVALGSAAPIFAGGLCSPAARVVALEPVPNDASSLASYGAAKAGELRLRAAAAGAPPTSIDGVVLSPRAALVVELQAELSIKGKMRFVTVAWGALVPYADGAYATGHVSLELAFGAARPPPLSAEPSALAGPPLATGVKASLDLRAPAWRQAEAEVPAEQWRAMRAAADAAAASLEAALPPAAAELADEFQRANFAPAKTTEPEAATSAAVAAAAAAPEATEAVAATTAAPAAAAAAAVPTAPVAAGAATTAALVAVPAAAAPAAAATDPAPAAPVAPSQTPPPPPLTTDVLAPALGPIAIEIHSCQLLGPLPSVTSLWVSLSTKAAPKQLRTPRFAKSNRATALDYESVVELFGGSVGEVLATELSYKLRGDGGAVGAESLPLGEGTVSLGEVLGSARGLRKERLPLFSDAKTEVAELVISASATGALLASLAPPPAAPHAAAAAPLDLTETRDAATGTDPPRFVPSAEAYMETLRGSAHARSISQLLAEEPVPQPHASTRMTRAEKAEMWEASRRLGESAPSADAAAADDAEEEWHADATHNVVMQFISYAPSSAEAPPPTSLFASFQFYHFPCRTTPRALLTPPAAVGAASTAVGAGAAGAAAAASDMLRVAVESVLLPPGLRD